MSLPSDAAVKRRIRRRSHADFRRLIADVWEREGWETRIDHESQAHILASKQSAEGVAREAVQCHCLSKGNEVTVTQVEEHAALPAKAGVETVTIVTTTGFTDSAESAGDVPYMTLLDGSDLVALLRANNAGDLLDTHAPPTLWARLIGAIVRR